MFQVNAHKPNKSAAKTELKKHVRLCPYYFFAELRGKRKFKVVGQDSYIMQKDQV